ncbi:T9SS type A sorting domain-containing protein [candidate division KSB1 bacterium]|nr:T9SS type A sorting domain-containing protein [candidate division KSB1 bacterium]
MIKKMLLLVCAVLLAVGTARAQWRCLYATYDYDNNGTGHNTPGVAVLEEDKFVAIVLTEGSTDQTSPAFWNVPRNFLIAYAFADSAVGRLNTYGYGGAATNKIYEIWDAEYSLRGAWRATFGPGKKLYVANNDTIDHSILVFDYDEFFGLQPNPNRMGTGSTYIFDVDVDEAGYVYVLSNGDTVETTDDVRIYKSIGAEGATWETTHNDAPITTIDVPGKGFFGGIAVSKDGSQLFVSNRWEKKVQKFVGSPTTGYTLDAKFSFQLAEDDTLPNGRPPQTLALAFYDKNNLLALAAHRMAPGSGTANGYNYGKIHIINPFTGTGVDTIDVAMWNYIQCDSSYTNRGDGTTPGNASAYTSTYDVDWDENGNLYSQSHYGWTVEKWHNDNLPNITSAVEGEKGQKSVPKNFELEQNYPNPFNPATTITFSVPQPEKVTLKVYNLMGEEMKTLLDGVVSVGSHSVIWDGTDNFGQKVTSGLYLYTLQIGNQQIAKRMVLVK